MVFGLGGRHGQEARSDVTHGVRASVLLVIEVGKPKMAHSRDQLLQAEEVAVSWAGQGVANALEFTGTIRWC